MVGALRLEDDVRRLLVEVAKVLVALVLGSAAAGGVQRAELGVALRRHLVRVVAESSSPEG